MVKDKKRPRIKVIILMLLLSFRPQGKDSVLPHRVDSRVKVAQPTTVLNWQHFNQKPHKQLGKEKKKKKITQKGNRPGREKAGGPGEK